MSIHTKSSDPSHLKRRGYSMILNYTVEYLVMILIAVSVVVIIIGSHQVGLPLYKINPMHWVIYFTILFKKPSFSSVVLLAFALPLTSNLLTGHPLLFKSMIMGIELAIYGTIFISAIKYFNIIPVLAYVISQVTGHIVYYGLKYSLIKAELLDSILVSTSLLLQFVVFGALGIVLFLINKTISSRKLRD
jgi:hypothetical protein